ncbi:hypothetical protein [Streptomyces sp. NPDC005969]|uniref:hypothetical protein n=1 Tax=Streptomyces sp. NPDC005969 TaxID=3156722 RepID=UPI0033C86A57
MRRRFGTWVREAVLGRLGGLPEEAVAQLLSGSGREARIGGLHAGAAYGRLSAIPPVGVLAGEPQHHQPYPAQHP